MAGPGAVVDDWQAPSKVSFCLPEVVQLNKLPLATLLRVKDGPVSEVNFGSLGDDPGSISIRRSHCSTCHDWYCLEPSTHVVVMFIAADTSFVLILSVGRAPAAVLFGTQ